MKSALIALFAAVVGFAAGWYFRSPESESHSVTGRLLVQEGNQAAHPGLSGDGVNNALTGEPPVPIRPLESLEELLDVIQDIEGLGQIGAVSAVQVLPRLMITDLPTIRRLVDELAAHNHNPKRDLYAMAHFALMFRWLTLQPAEAVGFSLANPNLLGDFDEANQFALLYLARTRPDAVRTLLPLLPEKDRQEVDTLLTTVEHLSNPSAILTDAEKRSAIDSGAVGMLTKAWARKDTDAAVQWMMNLPEQERSTYSPMIFQEWFTRDSDAAAAWHMNLPDGPEKAMTTESMVSALGNPNATREQLESSLGSLPAEVADPVRLAWLSRNAWKSNSKPEELAGELSSIIGRNSSATGIATEAASTIANLYVRDERLNDGVQWAMSLPDDGLRSAAVSRIIAEWAQQDPTAASGWITDLPSGQTRDHAVVSLVHRISSDDPEAATIWARSIGDDALRQENTKHMFRRWMEQDPFAAVQALLEVPAEDREKMFPPRQE